MGSRAETVQVSDAAAPYNYSNPGFYGEYCQHRECLNNCSYPNGVCIWDEELGVSTGECDCRPVYDPYNNTRQLYGLTHPSPTYMYASSVVIDSFGGPVPGSPSKLTNEVN